MIDYLPIVTTVIAAGFAAVLWRHWRRSRTTYLGWWTFGVITYGVGTLAESLNTIIGWSPWLFRSWYIAGALLGAFPLAQGTAYLLLKKRTADRITAFFAVYLTVAGVAVLLTPLIDERITGELTGSVMAWTWVRFMSPLANTYAVVLLVGGAMFSAWRYWRRSDRPLSRVYGNVLIATGGILPGIGGSFARAGNIDVLYVTEVLGIVLIYLGYRAIVGDSVTSIHRNQRAVQESSTEAAVD